MGLRVFVIKLKGAPEACVMCCNHFLRVLRLRECQMGHHPLLQYAYTKTAKSNGQTACQYYSPLGYWRRVEGIKKLAQASKVYKGVAHKWLINQAFWQPHGTSQDQNVMYLYQMRSTRPTCLCPTIPLVAGRGCKTYKYILMVIDVASSYKKVNPLTSKDSAKVPGAFQKIYNHCPLRWPRLLQVDRVCKFVGAVSKETMAKRQRSLVVRAPDLKSRDPVVKSSSLPLAGFVFGSPELNSITLCK